MTTLKDIAARAGISASIASRILNPQADRSGRYSDETRRRVERIARELGYHADRRAQCLKRGQNSAIGVFIPYWPNSLVADLIVGLSEGAEELGFALSLHFDLGPESYRRFISSHREHAHCGIITYPAGRSEARVAAMLDDFRAGGGSLVMLNTARPETVSVCIDNVLGGRLAAERLIARGPKSFFLLGSYPERVQGFSATLRAAEKQDATHCHSAAELAAKLKQAALPAGIFTTTDLYALDALKIMLKLGFAPGKDALLVGYDNLYGVERLPWALTTVSQPFREEGRLAISKLVGLIDGTAQESAMLEPELMIRDTA